MFKCKRTFRREYECGDSDDVFLLHAVAEHLPPQIRKGVDGQIALVGQTDETVLRIVAVRHGNERVEA